MTIKRVFTIGLTLAFLAPDAPAQGATTSAMISLAGTVPQQVRSAALLSHVADTEPVALSLVANIDEERLDQTLKQLYASGSPERRRFLSAQEFATRFGLGEKRQALKEFATRNGLTVDTAHDEPESLVVHVTGTAAAAQRAFNVQLNQYRTPAGRVFRANATDPTIPATLAPYLRTVLGLSNVTSFAVPANRARYLGPNPAFPTRVAPSAGTPTSAGLSGGTGPGNTLAPADIRSIYKLDIAGVTGAGQRAAVVELDGYNPTDIAQYLAAFNAPSLPVTPVSVDGAQNLCDNAACTATSNPSSGVIEVALDIEMIAAAAPGTSEILVYIAPNSGAGLFDCYDQVAAENRARAVSISWGIAEQYLNASYVQAEAVIFKRMAAQGQSVYAASGDDGSTAAGGTATGVADPSSQPYVTGVGGTTLAGSVASPSETAWTGSGGGISDLWPLPDYQQGVAGLASTGFRNVPDVSLDADPNTGYAVYVAGHWFEVGGTSAAAPLWAAMTVLLNQTSVGLGRSTLGFANPTIYAQYAAQGASLFNDITAGSNGAYNAGGGYDNVTGLGSYKGSAFITATAPLLPVGEVNTAALSNVYAFPNPYDVRKDASKRMTFANLPDDATVKIFTVSGFWIKTIRPFSGSGQAVWDLTNDSGDAVASGLYLYLVTSEASGAKAKGKIALIR